jgi:hypothetical protein
MTVAPLRSSLSLPCLYRDGPPHRAFCAGAPTNAGMTRCCVCLRHPSLCHPLQDLHWLHRRAGISSTVTFRAAQTPLELFLGLSSQMATVAVVSPRAAAPMADKYAALPAIVARMEPSDIGYVFKHAQQPHAFLPSMGLFAVEFALGYCHNLHYRRSNGGATVAAAYAGAGLGSAAASGVAQSAVGDSSVGRGRGRGARK